MHMFLGLQHMYSLLGFLSKLISAAYSSYVIQSQISYFGVPVLYFTITDSVFTVSKAS